MPYSDGSNIEWVRWFLNLAQPKTVLDIGAGAGKYGQLVKEVLPDTHVTGVEVWEPYIAEFNLNKIYDQIELQDARTFPSFAYDLVIFGDVLEHMTAAQAVALWNKARSEAKAALISIPIIHYPQGHIHDNPFEEHVTDSGSHEEVLATFPQITGYRQFEITATYVGEFR